jgi:hypothetical protein
MGLDELLLLKRQLRMQIFRLTNDVEAVTQYLDQLAEVEKQLKEYGY